MKRRSNSLTSSAPETDIAELNRVASRKCGASSTSVRRIRARISKCALAIATAFAVSPVMAQEAEADEQQKASQIAGIEVIEVSAEKRVSTLQETPIAISAFNAGDIARQNIEEANDIQFAIPNALFTDQGTFNIRGVGNNARSATSESGTGVHLNGVYLTAPSASNEFYDLQTIEVLRGPQGTLYGRNTTAGVVNIITRRPDEEWGGNISLELSNFDSVRALGALNFPITESVLHRFAFNYVKRDGFTENIATGNDIDGRDQFSIRSTTTFDISDNMNGMFFAQYFEEDSTRSNRRGVRCTPDPILGCSSESAGFEFVDSNYIDGNLLTVLAGAGIPVAQFVREDFYNTNPDGTRKVNPSDPRQVNLDNEPIAKADDLVVSLELNYEVDSGTFTSVTAFHDRSTGGQRDFDNANGSNAFLVPVSYVFNDDIILQNTQNFEPVQVQDTSSEQWSQEFRFVSSLNTPLNYTAGVYWVNYEVDGRVATFFPYLSIIGTALGLPTEFHDFDTRTPKAETTSWALFGEVYYDISDALKLTVGLRYSDEEKSQVTQTVTPLSFLNPAFDPTAFESLENDWQETTGKIGLSYQTKTAFTDETLFFGNLSRGYKAGGLNPGGTVQRSFDAEYINAIELGTKNTFLDRKFQANATLFYYDYDGLQLSALEQTGTGAAITANTDAKVSGAELEFVAAPAAGWLMNLNYSLLDSEITGDFPTPDGSLSSLAGPVDVRGNALPYAPDRSLQFGIQYSHEVSSNWEMTWRAQTYWQDDFFARVYNTTTDRLDSWSQTDFNVSLQDFEGKWKIEAFVKNVEDEASLTGLTVESSLAGRFRLPAILDPRQYGIRIHYNFDS